MKPVWVYLGLCFCAFVAANSRCESQERLTSLDLLNQGIKNVDPDTIPAATRQHYGELLRAEGTNEKGSGYLDFLIRLKDEAAIEGAIREWEKSAGRNFGLSMRLKGSASPWLIPQLAGFLYGEDLPKPRSYPNPEMGPDLGFHDATSLVVQEILLGAPEVPQEVKDSIRFASHGRTAAMRRWWEANREAFLTERYDLLQPLTKMAAKRQAATSEAAPKAEIPVVAPAPTASPPPAAAPAPALAPEPNRETNWWLWSAAGVAVLAAIILLARARR